MRRELGACESARTGSYFGLAGVPGMTGMTGVTGAAGDVAPGARAGLVTIEAGGIGEVADAAALWRVARLLAIQSMPRTAKPIATPVR